MDKGPLHFLNGIRSHWLRILKRALVYFITFNYGITSSLAIMSLDMIEASPTTQVKLLTNPHGDFKLIADGDIKIRKFSSRGNLIIQTPGNITFAEDGLVGSFLNVDAKDILVAKGVRLQGKKAYLQAHQKVHIGGSFESEEDLTIKAAQQVDILGTLSSRCGTLDLYGSEFNNFGDVEAFKGIRGDIRHFKNYNLFRTKGNILLRTLLFNNLFNNRTQTRGRLFAFGLLRIDNVGSYVDAGEIYSPLLSTISANSIQFLSTHRFYGNEIDIRANNINAEKGTAFYFQNMLHFSSTSDSFSHYGDVIQIESGLFPYYKDYFPERRLPRGVLIPDLGELTEAIHLKEYDIIRDAIVRAQRGKSIVALRYSVKGDLERKGKDICLSGTLVYYIDGRIISDGHQVQSGLFATDDVLVQAANMAIKNSFIKSYGSAHLASRGDTSFYEVAVQADKEAHVGIEGQLTISRTLNVILTCYNNYNEIMLDYEI